ncbi:MAG: hypothetical protein E5V24_12620 [Mesorhizobium sp.]|nr:MAG: hypothetical protein EOS67_02480 [Mesorhizobium sp.]TIX93642.1 MAG: hypothetical protein E5V24_12620 [Mesorhizobium sp.]
MCDEPAWFGHCARGHCLASGRIRLFRHEEPIQWCEGEELSSSEFGGYETVMYIWDGNGFGGNMNAMFQNGAMVSKAQFGLK